MGSWRYGERNSAPLTFMTVISSYLSSLITDSADPSQRRNRACNILRPYALHILFVPPASALRRCVRWRSCTSLRPHFRS